MSNRQPWPTEEQDREFREKAGALIKWLCENGHPHMTVIVTPTGAELLEGSIGHINHSFIKK